MLSVVFLALPFTDGLFGIEWNPDKMEGFRFLFPTLSAIVSILSIIIAKIESTNVQRQLLGVRSLLSALNERYDDIPKNFCTKHPTFYYLVQYEPVNMIIWIYAIITVGAIFETVYFINPEIIMNNLPKLSFGFFIALIAFIGVALSYFHVKKTIEAKEFKADNPQSKDTA